MPKDKGSRSPQKNLKKQNRSHQIGDDDDLQLLEAELESSNDPLSVPPKGDDHRSSTASPFLHAPVQGTGDASTPMRLFQSCSDGDSFSVGVLAFWTVAKALNNQWNSQDRCDYIRNIAFLSLPL